MVPATQVVVVVADYYVPPNVKLWEKYQVAKRVFLNDNKENCFQLYHCNLDIKHPNELINLIFYISAKYRDFYRVIYTDINDSGYLFQDILVAQF